MRARKRVASLLFAAQVPPRKKCDSQQDKNRSENTHQPYLFRRIRCIGGAVRGKNISITEQPAPHGITNDTQYRPHSMLSLFHVILPPFTRPKSQDFGRNSLDVLLGIDVDDAAGGDA